ncbi:MAG: pantoate--beta-alanine ligase, partial [Myxococcales bacterium]|nr:pantoate--beta-alanine ligase [Myxococcales bacterium]
FAAGERDVAALIAAARAPLDAAPVVRVDYVELRDDDDLTAITTVTGRAVLAIAAFVGKTRLIDNRVLGAKA